MPTVQVSPEADELLQIVANGVLKSRKIIVVTGAGISTNSGIPDFRSENGLYALIQAQFDSANRDPASPTALSRTNSTSSDSSAASQDDGPPAKRRKLDQTDDVGWKRPHGSRRSGPRHDRVESLKSRDCVKVERTVSEQLTGAVAREDPVQVEENGSVAPVGRGSHMDSCSMTRTRTLPGRTTDLMTPPPVHRRRNSWGGSAKPPTCSRGGVPLGCEPLSHSISTELALSNAADGHARPPGSPDALTSAHCITELQDLKSRPCRPTGALASVHEKQLLLDSGSGDSYGVDPGPWDTPKRVRRASLTSLPSADDGQTRTASKPQEHPQSLVRDHDSSEHPHDLSPGLPRLPLSLLSAGPHSLRLTPKQIPHLPLTSSPLSSPPPSSQRQMTFLRRRKASEAHTPSRLIQLPLAHDSSPLSSPPPVLFDPFQQPSSSTSQQSSSAAGSTTCSETDETPPSSRPSLISQTSNPTRTSLPNIKGRDLFDVSIWADPLRTSVFYTFATTLRQKARDVQPTASHLFISHLRDRGKLVRCYTQNIDQIEEKVGLSTSLQQGPGSRGRFSRKSAGGFSAPSSQGAVQGGGGEGEAGEPLTKRHDAANGGVECVFLHGSLQSLRCFLCGRVCEWDEGGRSLETLSGRQPECPHCVGATVAREERGKRALGVGKLRPDIVLYGEEHPNAHLIDPLVKHDLALYPDSLLILGTSLKVHGLKVLVREFAKTVHSKGGKVIFVNFTKPPESSWGDIIDYWIQWDCDAWVSNLQERVPLLWLPPGTKLPGPGKRKRESSGEGKVAKRRPSEGGKPAEGSDKTGEADDVSNVEAKQEVDDSEQIHPCLEQSAPRTAPRRPQVMREDKHNAAYLTWQISRDLRKITGDDTPLMSFSTTQRGARLDRLGTATVSPAAQLSETPSRTPLPGAASAQAPRRLATSTRTPLPGASGDAVRPASAASRTPLPTDCRSTPLTTGSAFVQAPIQATPASSQALVPIAAMKKSKTDPRRTRTPLPSAMDAVTSSTTKTKPTSSRRRGPGWFYASEDDTEPGELLDESENPERAADDAISGDASASIGAAIKANPRKRKRKVIDGEEVALPGSVRRPGPSTPRAMPVKGLFNPPSQTKPTPVSLPLPSSPSSSRLQGPINISPKIVSDLRRVSMDTVELAPIRVPVEQHLDPGNAPAAPPKPAPMEPCSPPSGPLSRISANLGISREQAFGYFDSLVLKLSQPPAWMGWTPGPEAQLRSEADAALALGQMRMGS